MSTRSAIIRKTENGFEGIYCHSDGYPSYTGAILNEHYQDADRVRRLIELGDLSILGKKLDPSGPHGFDYDKREKDVTVAYGRDRGEPDTEAVRGDTVESVTSQIDHVYAYVFADGDWTCNGRPLVEAIKADQS